MDKRMAGRQPQWRLDGKTAARLRIYEIWRGHPEYSGKRIVKALGADHAENEEWVRKILRQLARATGRQTPQQQFIGRRIYNSF